MSFLDDKLIKELAGIKERIAQSTYQILQPAQWKKDLAQSKHFESKLVNTIYIMLMHYL